MLLITKRDVKNILLVLHFIITRILNTGALNEKQTTQFNVYINI